MKKLAVSVLLLAGLAAGFFLHALPQKKVDVQATEGPVGRPHPVSGAIDNLHGDSKFHPPRFITPPLASIAPRVPREWAQTPEDRERLMLMRRETLARRRSTFAAAAGLDASGLRRYDLVAAEMNERWMFEVAPVIEASLTGSAPLEERHATAKRFIDALYVQMKAKLLALGADAYKSTHTSPTQLLEFDGADVYGRYMATFGTPLH